MPQDKAHDGLRVHMERGADDAVRMVFGLSADISDFTLIMPSGRSEVRIFRDKGGEPYLVFKLADGSYHVLKEVGAKEAAVKHLGARGQPAGDALDRNTRQFFAKAWETGETVSST
jgi:hypothetical protein